MVGVKESNIRDVFINRFMDVHGLDNMDGYNKNEMNVYFKKFLDTKCILVSQFEWVLPETEGGDVKIKMLRDKGYMSSPMYSDMASDITEFILAGVSKEIKTMYTSATRRTTYKNTHNTSQVCNGYITVPAHAHAHVHHVKIKPVSRNLFTRVF